MMRAHKSAVLVTGAILLAGAFLSGQALSQNAPAQPAVQGASIMPIGKVVTAAGSISIEHVSAVVVQASLGGQSGDAKVGDSVYLGDVVSTGSDGRVGISFADGTAFDLSSNARMHGDLMCRRKFDAHRRKFFAGRKRDGGIGCARLYCLL